MIMVGSKSRIAIVGAAGVGKTTLLNGLFDGSVSSYVKIDEVVRTLAAERGYNSPYDIPETEVHQFRRQVLDRQIVLENQAEKFIIDRSTLDAWVYFMRWSWNSVTVEFSEEFYQAAYKQALNYDLLVYIPIMFPVEDDGFRWSNAVYQTQIDRLLKSVINEWGLAGKVYEIESGTVLDRLNEFKQQLL